MALPRYFIAERTPVRVVLGASSEPQAEVFDPARNEFIPSTEMLTRLRDLPEQGIAEVSPSIFNTFVERLRDRAAPAGDTA